MPRTLPPVDDDVFAALQSLAEPLVDDINTVLRRLLRLNERPRVSAVGAESASLSAAARSRASTPSKSKKTAKTKVPKERAPRGSLLPESEYELPILRFLSESGGRAPASEVVEAIGTVLKDKFTEVDKQPIESGDVRWKSRVQFVRLKLIKTGDMASEAPRGVWAISDQGERRVREGR